VKIRGRAKLYNDQIELTVDQIQPVGEHEYDLADFLPHTKEDVEKLYARLREAVASVKNPWIRMLLVSVVEDPALAPKLKRAPAAMMMHHAFLGGLLEHVVSLLGLMEGVALHYPELDRDMLIAGIVLHDVGKTDELTYGRGIGYTTEGELLGHIAIGQAIVRRKIDAIPGFPGPLAVAIEHLILSHHGSLEFGSPKLPQFREAVALNFLDDMDSKMAAMRATLDAGSGSGDWSERNPALRRNLLRLSEYLGEPEERKSAAGKASAGEKAAAPLQQGLGFKK
jgi:3'-5' exoribonuclease